MLLEAKSAQLVLLDFQTAYSKTLPESAALLSKAARLLRLAQLFGVPAISTQLPTEVAGEFALELQQPEARHIVRTPYSAAAVQGANILGLLEAADQSPKGGNARSLPKHLQKAAAEPRSDIILAGWQTHGAVLQTALDLIEQEWEVFVVVDACASRTTRDHDAALDRLAGQGVELVTFEMLALEWLSDTQHKYMAQVQALLPTA